MSTQRIRCCSLRVPLVMAEPVVDVITLDLTEGQDGGRDSGQDARRDSGHGGGQKRAQDGVTRGNGREQNDSSGSNKRQSEGVVEEKENSEVDKVSGPPKMILLGLKAIIAIVFFVIFIVSSVLSKLTLLSLTEALRNISMSIINETMHDIVEDQSNAEESEMTRSKSMGITIYWQLLIILIVPNILTFLRCLFFGFLGKTRDNFPWPRKEAVVAGLFGSVLEVFGMCLLVFIVLAAFPVGVSILLLSGVFFFQIAIDMLRLYCSKHWKNCKDKFKPLRKGYGKIHDNSGRGNEDCCPLLLDTEEVIDEDECKVLKILGSVLDNPYVKFIALVMQGIGLTGVLIFWIYTMLGNTFMKLDRMMKYFYLCPLVALPMVILSMSLIWSNIYQEGIASTKHRARKDGVENESQERTARYKSSLINSSCRIFLYPFVSYIVFCYLTPFRTKIDPWCLNKSCEIDISGETLNVMIVHIVASLVGYLVAWVACTMTLSQFSLGIPLLLSSPVSLACYFLLPYVVHWPFMEDTSKAMFDRYLVCAYLAGAVLWLGGILAMGFFVLTKTNIVLARDEDMFLTPHYDPIFLEQHIILNRQVKKFKRRKNLSCIDSERKPEQRTIFICSTMYRENTTEMKQMLVSIARVAKHYTAEHSKDSKTCDRFESHIFFDGAITGNHIENFGLQLLSLLNESLNVNIKKGCIKTETPYGYTFSWKIGKIDEVTDGVMPFTIHFKDRNKVKPKKRWSQVMYMNYVLKYRLKKDALKADNTFILTTDADIDFTADSAIVLLDMMDSNNKVAAVSARTHPKGYGPMYWYQLFDYAIGHWFQKPAEHILGSVLCSPGCFSVFRCSALELVIKEYSTEVTNASEFLMKDMGEDRWLCTLIIKQGLRLEYCAISEDYTYCPTEFNEFYKQRRRWIPSTIANLFMLVSESSLITRGNDSISILYILFQSIMIFSTAIAPATVVLVISAGLESFNIPAGVSVTVFFTVGVVYGLICLYASPKAQLDVAKLLTFFFTIVMAMVAIGIFKDVVEDFTSSPTQKLIGPGNCNDFSHSDMDYEQCMRSHAFALNSNNSVGKHFTLPVTPTLLYISALAVAFFLAGVFHFNEFTCLFHSIWFLLALPSGYLLLLIYSAANVCDRSWGTREQSSGEDEGIWGWKKHLVKGWNLLSYSRCCLWCFGGPRSGHNGGEEGGGGGAKVVAVSDQLNDSNTSDESKVKKEKKTSEEGSEEPDGVPVDSLRPTVNNTGMREEVKKWLSSKECETYLPNFEEHGYTTITFIASISQEDLETIGIEKAGYRHRLRREIKNLDTLPLEKLKISKTTTVGAWLTQLELGEYEQLFHHEGYKTEQDLEALALLSEAELRVMGISKRAHLQRLMKAISCLIIPPAEMEEEAREWLQNQECQCYEEDFIRHGYTTRHFLSGIKEKELQEVGVEKKGLRLRLQKAAQRLPSLPINTDIPENVAEWLKELELMEYENIFHHEGYKTMEDIENLKELTVDQLKAMGIHRTAHLGRLKTALNHLAKPSLGEQNKRKTKGIIDHLVSLNLKDTNEEEFKFWTKLIKDKLKPVALKFTQVKDVQKSLERLRNLVLAALLLINLMWIVLLFSLTFWQLQQYSIDPRAFQLLFLGVYGFIIGIQFFTMLAHRAVTLIHCLGRVKPKEVEPERNIAIVSMRQSQFELQTKV